MDVELALKMCDLSDYECKILKYLVSKNQPCTAYKIGRDLGLPLSQTYDAVSAIENQGLIITVHKSPKKVKVQEDLLLNFIDNKINESKLQVSNLQGLKKRVQELSLKKQGEVEMRIMRGRDRVLNFLAAWLPRNVKKRYYFVSSLSSSTTPIQDIIGQLAKKGADLKIIGPEGHSPEIAQKYVDMGFDVRIVDKLIPPFRMSIQDDYVALTLVDTNGEYLTIWTNCPSTHKAMEEFFDFLWNSGKKLTQ